MRSITELEALPVCFGTCAGVSGGVAIRAKWIQIRTYESLGSKLPDELAAWKANVTNKIGSRLAEWKARLLQNLGDDGVLGRRLRFGQTQEEARAAILSEWKARLLQNLGDDGVLGRRLRLGQTQEEARRGSHGGQVPECCGCLTEAARLAEAADARVGPPQGR